jgi:hypothetical protein
MRTAKYNFRRQENKEKAVYKLVMYPREGTGIKGSYTNSRGNRVVVFYGYYKKDDFGLQMLRSLVQRYKGKFNLARIYAKPNLNPNHDQFNEIVETYKN